MVTCATFPVTVRVSSKCLSASLAPIFFGATALVSSAMVQREMNEVRMRTIQSRFIGVLCTGAGEMSKQKLYPHPGPLPPDGRGGNLLKRLAADLIQGK